MTDHLHAGRIDVEDLGEPAPLPPEFAEELADDVTPSADDPHLPERAGILGRVITSLFQIAGIAGGFRLPAAFAAAVRAVWRVDAGEVSEIATSLAPLVPDRWLASRALRATGIAGGLLLLAGSVASRATETARIRQEVSRDHAHSPADAEPAADAGARRAGPRRGGAGEPAAVEPESAGAVEPVDGFSGAGLGLGADQ